VSALPAAAGRVLDILASSERPLEQRELELTTEQDGRAVAKALDRLREEHLVNVSMHRGRPAFEILHAKLRTAVRSLLEPERGRECHRRLATVFEASGSVDPETLAFHYFEAGDESNALKWTEVAADRATSTV